MTFNSLKSHQPNNSGSKRWLFLIVASEKFLNSSWFACLESCVSPSIAKRTEYDNWLALDPLNGKGRVRLL
jgi:hypothetical protein